MATISGGSKHTYALVTFDTERDDTLQPGEVIRERFVLRSDGALLSRLVAYGPVDRLHRPSSGFRIVRKYALGERPGDRRDTLRAALQRRLDAQGVRTLKVA